MAKALALMTTLAAGLALPTKSYNQTPAGRGSSILSVIRESYSGAWQRSVTINVDTVMTNPAIWACQTLIASDIAKLRVLLVEIDKNGIWTETESASFSPVLRKPNHFQTRMQFWENWMLSKLSTGNTYVLLNRDARGVVNEMFILDPTRVTVKVSPAGDIYYALDTDNIAGITVPIAVPASEIIHDRYNCLYHPLVGLSAIFAAGLAATQGLNILQDATQFFGNRSIPGGIILVPGKIEVEKAAEMKANWETNYGGENRGKIAVLGDNMKFEPTRALATDSQMVEQLKWSSEVISSCYHVPPYKIGIGQIPAGLNVQAVNVEYHSQALQGLITAAEECLDDGLGLGAEGATKRLGVEFQESDLLRMDALTQMEVLDKGKNTMTPNEARKRINLGPIEGGNAVYRQQQDYSLSALAKRDAQDDPFGKASAPAAPPAADSAPAKSVTPANVLKMFDRKAA
jgi:HK97 family phage portal protein